MLLGLSCRACSFFGFEENGVLEGRFRFKLIEEAVNSVVSLLLRVTCVWAINGKQ